MSSNRQDRLRRRRAERTAPASGSSGGPTGRPTSSKPAWRQTLDSWGGFPILSVVVIIVVVAVFFIFQMIESQPSTAALMGEEYGDTRSDHVAVGSLTEPPTRPPAGGPHYPAPWPTGIYTEEIEDGYLVHSLEHGIIWVSYNPELVTDDQLAGLERVANDHSRDVILAPRSANDAPVYVMSWGRRMQAEADDLAIIEQFIETNVNRSPEPGVR